MPAEADREARAMTETLAQWRLAEVPSRAVQVNDQQAGLVVCTADPALAGEPIVPLTGPLVKKRGLHEAAKKGGTAGNIDPVP